MKFALLFVIGLCAVSAQPFLEQKEAQISAMFAPVYYPMARDGVLETAKEYIEKVIANIKAKVDDLIENAKTSAAFAKESVLDALQSGAEKVAAFITETEGKITELANQGMSYKICVEKFKPKAADLYNQAKEDVKDCTKDGREFAENVLGTSLDKLLGLKKYVLTLRDAVKECYQPSNPVASVSCATGKFSEVKDSIAKIFKDAADTFSSAASIATKSYNCVKDSTVANKAQAEAIVEEIKQCATA